MASKVCATSRQSLAGSIRVTITREIFQIQAGGIQEDRLAIFEAVPGSFDSCMVRQSPT